MQNTKYKIQNTKQNTKYKTKYNGCNFDGGIGGNLFNISGYLIQIDIVLFYTQFQEKRKHETLLLLRNRSTNIEKERQSDDCNWCNFDGGSLLPNKSQPSTLPVLMTKTK